MKTPDWILEGYDSRADWEKVKGIKSETISKSNVSNSRNKGDNKTSSKKGKKFKIKICPKCKSEDVGLVLINSDAEEGGGTEWECRKCGWKGEEIQEKELTEEEFMKYLN